MNPFYWGHRNQLWKSIHTVANPGSPHRSPSQSHHPIVPKATAFTVADPATNLATLVVAYPTLKLRLMATY
ncbi:MAG: hypothetical protein HQL84_08285 [Magnetococcales bacterium]|nr:hypothetical protein [Magnetococcales bacterium]MBF0150027.1 hypothetical protein [Magnetococcales bacterium]